ncbi:MAG: hypothetical protein ONB43_26455 [candidate division KSB1 bacterium]|nr:hypothetical protein [candidate division KSB1 bacterium]MDZ7403203.1 hypothetical protein [candidate division KSB1 bacterium]
MKIFVRWQNFFCAIVVLISSLGCSTELDYPQKAREFYARYAKSREVALLIHYNINPRGNKLYLQECGLRFMRAPEDTMKTWAIYENYRDDDPQAKIEMRHIKIAQTPFDDSGRRGMTPAYETASEVDTTGNRGEALLHVRDTIRAFHQLGLREVVCGGQNVVYLVHKEFMLIYVAEADQTPESIKNIAAKLDENWYYEISLEHQEAQRLRLINVLREFWGTLQQADTTKN